MPETSLTLIVAALLFAVALLAWLGSRVISLRAAAFRTQLLAADERLVIATPLLAARLGVQQANLAELSAATERALWSLHRLDEGLDSARTGLATRRAELDRARTRIRAAHATLASARRRTQMLIKVMELRRAILG